MDINVSTTWKTAAIWFGVGVVSTTLVTLGVTVVGAILWGASLLYIGYKAYEANTEDDD